MSNGFPPDPPRSVGAKPLGSVAARLLSKLSFPLAEDLDIFLERKKRRFMQNVGDDFLSNPVLRFLGSPFSPEGFGGPAKSIAKSVLPFVQRTAKKVPKLKKSAKTVSPITSAPSTQNRVKEKFSKLRERLVTETEIIPGEDAIEIAEELGTKISKKGMGKILKEHGVVEAEEIQRLRFEVKPDADGRFDLAKILAWLGY